MIDEIVDCCDVWFGIDFGIGVFYYQQGIDGFMYWVVWQQLIQQIFEGYWWRCLFVFDLLVGQQWVQYVQVFFGVYYFVMQVIVMV